LPFLLSFPLDIRITSADTTSGRLSATRSAAARVYLSSSRLHCSTKLRWSLANANKGVDVMQVMLRVSNLEESIKYYEQCLGMQLIRKRENPGATGLPPSHACLISFTHQVHVFYMNPFLAHAQELFWVWAQLALSLLWSCPTCCPRMPHADVALQVSAVLSAVLHCTDRCTACNLAD
jgi:hypothetical protein